MKYSILFIGIASALVVSCSIQEENQKALEKEDVVFYASFEQSAEEMTKVYSNKDLFLRWNAEDRVSIFNKNTYNQEYRFTGETGDNAGEFSRVDGYEFVTGNSITNVVSVYPYQESTKIDEEGILTMTLPSEQHYAENTFGLGANTMVSVSSDTFIQYKNVGGYLRLSLYGKGITVSSIMLKGNNGEKLAGKATVSMPRDGVPTVVMSDDATPEITLICDTPIALGTTAEASKDFWFVVPPVSFSRGFTITVFGSRGECCEKTTSKRIIIERSKLSKMSSIVIDGMEMPSNVIYYVSSDEQIVSPYQMNAFGATIVSNEYRNGRGVITFDQNVTSIGDNAFYGCSSLLSIVVPEDVSSIGHNAFSGCSNLTDISLPERVNSFGDFVFYDCSSLHDIVIPEGVTSIGHTAFGNCSGLKSIRIPASVTSIGKYAFFSCTSLTSIVIPQNVTDIGELAFYLCSSLIDVTIPERLSCIREGVFQQCSSLSSITITGNVTSIGTCAFYGCTSLTSISLPESVTSIGNGCFGSCTSLTTISLPNELTSIGENAFSDCTSLLSIVIPEEVTSIGSNAFRGCSSLSHVIVADGVTSIGTWAFSHCSSLTSIVISKGITSIEEGTFYDCQSLLNISLPDYLTSIGDNAFDSCTSLLNIVIPEGVTSIGHTAFGGCANLTSIVIPGNVKSIGNFAFYDCLSIASVTVEAVNPPYADQYMFDYSSTAPIYVPSGSVDAYKAASGWSSYASRIQAIQPFSASNLIVTAQPQTIQLTDQHTTYSLSLWKTLEIRDDGGNPVLSNGEWLIGNGSNGIPEGFSARDFYEVSVEFSYDVPSGLRSLISVDISSMQVVFDYRTQVTITGTAEMNLSWTLRTSLGTYYCDTKVVISGE